MTQGLKKVISQGENDEKEFGVYPLSIQLSFETKLRAIVRRSRYHSKPGYEY
jgi:hypothetical protein